ncbi:protein SODIUM POTASSIUM ROOT DEFECTIVE 1-like [Camellia sinensis]|uniref:HMA domain-containing protein n=1 Tax=Camellia sinensis var. sinensis TaxID=542762 RepID=A0A4S4EK09_CAMSN|nr:protein SODIUM POTASSIUM ROOT DEFECTIVE 1-like [Camellia sinensis]THG16903.1 hypothetical protein TEA_025626 [Camellia sinensis var. sinensis]
MKRMDLFCASPASTAICSSLDQRSVIRHGTRPISRHSHHVSGGDRRRGLIPPVPCTSQLPIDPKPYYQRTRKSSAKQSDINELTSPPGSSRYLLSDTPFFNVVSDSDHVKALVLPRQSLTPRHLSANDSPSIKSSSTRRLSSANDSPSLKSSSTRHQSNANDSPSLKSSSTRHLSSANDSPSIKSSSTRHLSSANDSPSLKSSSTHSHSRDKVVELRVSIHCKGCEGKVRKHISRMEGVTSFSIDLASKKVTIIGDVTPLGVLTSISRVKNAQFWPSPTSSSSPSSPTVKLSH